MVFIAIVGEIVFPFLWLVIVNIEKLLISYIDLVSIISLKSLW